MREHVHCIHSKMCMYTLCVYSPCIVATPLYIVITIHVRMQSVHVRIGYNLHSLGASTTVWLPLKGHQRTHQDMEKPMVSDRV